MTSDDFAAYWFGWLAVSPRDVILNEDPPSPTETRCACCEDDFAEIGGES